MPFDPADYSQCIFALRMDNADITGTTITDRGSGGHNGTLVNAPTTGVAGKIDQAITFNGSNQAITAATIGVSDITVAAWIYSTANPASQMIVEKAPVGGEWLLMLESGSLKWRGGNTSADLTFPQPSINAWHHIVATQTGTNAVLYIDGIQVASTASADAIPNGTGAIYVGAGVDFSSYYFNGSLDEVRIYNRPLSSTEVADLYNFTGSGTGPAYGTPASNSNGTIITIPVSGGTPPYTFTGGATTVTGSIFAESSFAGVHVTGANATISGSTIVCHLAVPIGKDQTLPTIDSTNLHGLQDANGTAFPPFTALPVTNSSTLVAATPAGFTLTPFSNRVVVSWTADADCNTNVATKIYRSTDNITFTLRTTINNSATNVFNDTTAVNGTQYWYYATREYFGSGDVSAATSTLTTEPPAGVPVVTSITVSPGRATLANNANQTFTVTAFDQFGNSMSNIGFSGSIVLGGGSLSNLTYTSDGNPAVVKFANGTVSGTSRINFKNNLDAGGLLLMLLD